MLIKRRLVRDRQHVQLGLGDEAEGALRPAQDGVEVESALRVADVSKIVAGEAAVEPGKALGDQRGVLALDGRRPADGRRRPGQGGP